MLIQFDYCAPQLRTSLSFLALNTGVCCEFCPLGARMAALQRRFHHWVGWGGHNVDILLAVAYCSVFIRIHSVHCCKCVCKGVHTYVHTYMHIFAHARAHTDRHTHSYTHTHTQTITDRQTCAFTHADKDQQGKLQLALYIYIIMYTIHRTIYVLERNSYDCPHLAILCNVMPCVCVCASIYVWVYIRIYVYYAYMKQSMSVALCCH